MVRDPPCYVCIYLNPDLNFFYLDVASLCILHTQDSVILLTESRRLHAPAEYAFRCSTKKRTHLVSVDFTHGGLYAFVANFCII